MSLDGTPNEGTLGGRWTDRSSATGLLLPAPAVLALGPEWAAAGGAGGGGGPHVGGGAACAAAMGGIYYLGGGTDVDSGAPQAVVMDCISVPFLP